MAERVLTKVLENVHDVSLLYRQATGNIINKIDRAVMDVVNRVIIVFYETISYLQHNAWPIVLLLAVGYFVRKYGMFACKGEKLALYTDTQHELTFSSYYTNF
jgi:hypothetical protein